MKAHNTIPSRIVSRRRRAALLHGLLAPICVAGACDFLTGIEVSTANHQTSTSEQGDAVDLVVRPRTAPSKPIEVFGVSSDPQEGAVTGRLRFDASNWQSPQSLKVTGGDDELADGDTRYFVDVYAQEAGSHNGRRWLLDRIALVNRDDESSRFEAIADLPGGASRVIATAASEDGVVVVGQSAGELGMQAFRWTGGKSVVLGGANSSALAVSPDGTQIVGSIVDPSYESGRAAAIFYVDQPAQGLSPAPQPGPDAGLLLWFVSASAVLNDETVYGTCHQYAAYGDPLGCRQRADGSLELVGGSFLHAADGLGHYAGTQVAARHAPFSSRPFFDGSTLALPSDLACPANIACSADVRGFSDGASRLVGTSALPLAGAAPGGPLYARAFTYTAADGFVFLPDLEGGELASGAYAVSGDGHIVAGYGSDERGQQAVIWLEREPRALIDVLRELDVDVADGWALRELRALSRDGHVLIGNGVNPQGDEQAFRVTLPLLP